jgi:linoleoyl-CoA desaturase
MKKIKFATGSSSPFFTALEKDVQRILFSTRLLRKANNMLWGKMIFYFLLYLIAIFNFFFIEHHYLHGLIVSYISLGLSGILLAFNVAHDACHGTFSKNKMVNYILYHLSFNLQGMNAYLWQIRHIASHHVFPNVDGCDADIDDNPFIRLSPQHPRRKYQRYQHIYSFIVYCIYTLHWLLFKDFLYLFKKRVANLKNKKHPLREWLLFLFWKSVYFTLIIFLPVYLGYPVSHVLISFLIMHVINSLFFIHILIITHLCMETQFPKTDQHGFLPTDFYVHQLATSLDYSPGSKICNFFLGGFNAHAAHHLYPRLPHTIYPVLSKYIKRKAEEFKVPYHHLSLAKAIRSHYRYLKVMGNAV